MLFSRSLVSHDQHRYIEIVPVTYHNSFPSPGYPLDYIPQKGRDKMYDAIQAFVQASEEKIIRAVTGGPREICIGLKVPIQPCEVSFLVEDIYKAKSAVTGIPTKLVLVRWQKPTRDLLIRIGEGADEQKSSDLKLSELVCMTKEEATRHQKEVLLGEKTLEELYSAEVIERVAKRQEEIKLYEKYR